MKPTTNSEKLNETIDTMLQIVGDQGEVAIEDVYLTVRDQLYAEAPSGPALLGKYTIQKDSLKYDIYGFRTGFGFNLSELEVYNKETDELKSFLKWDIADGAGVEEINNVANVVSSLRAPSTPSSI